MTPSDLKMTPGTFQDLPKWTPRAPKVTTQPPNIGQWHPMAPNVNTMVPKIYPKTSKALPSGAQRLLKQPSQPTATSQQPQLRAIPRASKTTPPASSNQTISQPASRHPVSQEISQELLQASKVSLEPSQTIKNHRFSLVFAMSARSLVASILDARGTQNDTK